MALAANSQSTASTAMRKFVKFLDERNIKLGKEGISDRDLRRYLAYLPHHGVKSHNTIKTYLSMGVRHFHEVNDLNFGPLKERPRVNAVYKGLKRELAQEHPTRQVMPITAELIIKMRRHFNLGDPFELCCFTAIILGFTCLLRKANIAHKTLEDKTGRKGKAKLDAGVPTTRGERSRLIGTGLRG